MPLTHSDTDMIIPKQSLKTIGRTGFGKALFDARRNTLDDVKIGDSR